MPFFLPFLLNLYRSLPGFRGKYRLGHFLFKPLLNKAEPSYVRVNREMSYYLPNSIENLSREIIVKGDYEVKTVRSIITEMEKKEKPVFFDIGANIGAIAIPVAKKLPSLGLHAFEASPVTYQYLVRNFKLNGLSTANLYNRAVHSTDDRDLPFFESVHHGKSSLAPLASNCQSRVRSISLDAYCRQHHIPHIDVVKVDVEGFEVEVFRGMRNLLREGRVSAIYFECEDWAEKAAGFRFGEAMDFLLGCGYEISDGRGRKLKTVFEKGTRMLWARPKFQNGLYLHFMQAD